MNRALIVLCALAIAAAGCGSSGESITDCYSIHRYKRLVQPSFDLHVMNVRADAGTRVDIYVQMQYSHLRFVKADSGYTASYAALFVIKDDDDRIVQSREASRLLQAESYDETVSLSADAFMQSFTLQPGSYTLEVSATDQNSQVRYVERRELVVQNLAPGAGHVSTMLLLLKPKTTQDDRNGTVLRPLFPQTVWYAGDSIGVFQEVYDLRRGDSVAVLMRYRTQSSEARRQGASDVTMSPPYVMATAPCPRRLDSTALAEFTELTIEREGTLPFVRYYPVPPAGFSNLELSIRIRRGDGGRDSAGSTLDLYRPRSLQATSDDIVEAMRYIARSSEYDSLRFSQGQERLGAIGRFWADRGGQSRRAEFEGRVEEANRLFSVCMEGSRTPMGVTYIVCGAPDAVECRSPYQETWFYTVGNQTMAVPFHVDRRNEEALYYELPTYSVPDALWRTFIDRWRRR